MRSAWDRVWIVIPAFDEAATIRVLAEAALALCPRVVVVDDGSRDGTAERVADLPLTLLRHEANRGKAASLRSAFSLQQTSLYFACVANGNSQMYDSAVFLDLLPRAGLAVARLSDGVGRFHTLLECVPAEAADAGSP